MRDAANAAMGFIQGRSRADLDTDLMLQFALIRALEVVGEAADKLPDSTQAAHPSLPWGDIIGMRHRLIHGDFDVDLDILWKVAIRKRPNLVTWLDATLSRPPGA
jgi:uncharacterized protein with HEPN domain